ncbi:MAG TPA: VIT family protein [Sphingomonas sp.]|uniref:VIT1/CCC1 transporter family protein n=1 Tax=Sphingomonas sp. TaxID=28214 RepID=UPI002BF32A8C|nr:VIT family protein [Sphingomonas sp.]HMI18059.1 VIT family protein [Sphingomonas sp.]
MTSRHSRHHEGHALEHIGWLRAAVLGANDGILSTASLIVGVASASADLRQVLIAGGAGLIAGSLSMAAGEYVSVSSQADLEKADLHRERRELHEDPEGELRELTHIYIKRGLEPKLAGEVAEQLTAHDALGAHARDELGLSKAMAAQPIQAALASAASFATGAAIPLAVTALAPFKHVSIAVVAVSVVTLAILGALGARTGRAPVGRAVSRVVLLGVAAMLLTIGLGRLFGTSV